MIEKKLKKNQSFNPMYLLKSTPNETNGRFQVQYTVVKKTSKCTVITVVLMSLIFMRR